MSPQIAICNFEKLLNLFFIVRASKRAWVGCSWLPSPALITQASTLFEILLLIPSSGCLTIKTSGFIELIVVIVSKSVSPLFIELSFTATLIRSAPNLLAATSKLVRVLVESSKNKLKIVLPSSRLLFFTLFLLKLINFFASSKINSISFLFKSAVSTRWIFLYIFFDVFLILLLIPNDE